MKTVHPAQPVQLQLFDLDGRDVLVVGLGLSGLAMARWAASRGARVSVVDTRQAPEQLETLRAQLPNVPFRSAPLSGELLDGVDALLWSPGLSTEIGDSAALHALARSRDIPVLGEIELFAQALSVLREQGYQPRVVAITGTNGKTTTTRLVGHLCQAAGISVAVAGNIAPAALDVLREAMESSALPSVWVLELSSFQLAVTDSLVADAAAILNLSQDHLDWHVSMDSYLDAKQRVYRGARVCVYNRDEPQTMPRKPGEHSGFGDSVPKQIGDFGIVHEGGLRWLATAVAEDDAPGKRRKEPVQVMLKRLMPAEALLIRGTHNQMNVLAALALAQAVGVPMARMLHGLRDFTGEEHRCQLVATIRDVQYYDDSKGTNVGATVAALGGLGRRCVLIAGGLGKGQDFSPLMAAVRDHAQAVLLIGRDAALLRAAIAPSGVMIEDCQSLEQAVRKAGTLAQPHDAVLLSPACASFDMFQNYGHRGQVFAQAVQSLAEQEGLVC